MPDQSAEGVQERVERLVAEARKTADGIRFAWEERETADLLERLADLLTAYERVRQALRAAGESGLNGERTAVWDALADLDALLASPSQEKEKP